MNFCTTYPDFKPIESASIPLLRGALPTAYAFDDLSALIEDDGWTWFRKSSPPLDKEIEAIVYEDGDFIAVRGPAELLASLASNNFGPKFWWKHTERQK